MYDCTEYLSMLWMLSLYEHKVLLLLHKECSLMWEAVWNDDNARQWTYLNGSRSWILWVAPSTLTVDNSASAARPLIATDKKKLNSLDRASGRTTSNTVVQSISSRLKTIIPKKNNFEEIAYEIFFLNRVFEKPNH